MEAEQVDLGFRGGGVMAGARDGEEESGGSVLLPHTVTAVPPALLCGNDPAPGGLVAAAVGRVSKGDCVLTVFHSCS